jgi:hypothetical protein
VEGLSISKSCYRPTDERFLRRGRIHASQVISGRQQQALAAPLPGAQQAMQKELPPVLHQD